jgi:hypothetical protein
MKRLSCLIVFLFSVAVSCAVSPSEDDLRNAIKNYFEGQHYGVVNIRLGKIEGVPHAEKTYMGTPAPGMSCRSLPSPLNLNRIKVPLSGKATELLFRMPKSGLDGALAIMAPPGMFQLFQGLLCLNYIIAINIAHDNRRQTVGLRAMRSDLLFFFFFLPFFV